MEHWHDVKFKNYLQQLEFRWVSSKNNKTLIVVHKTLNGRLKTIGQTREPLYRVDEISL